MIGLETDTRTTRFEYNESYLRALQRRDEAAENQLITSLGPRIRMVLRTHMRSWDRTADAYQETFLSALRLPAEQQVRHWRTMLLRIATRRAIDRLRQRYQSEKVTVELRQLAADQTPTETPDARAQSTELRAKVRQALAALPPQQAEAFWLRHLEQLAAGEVAEAMGIEPGHVRVLVHRAASSLRSLLQTTYGQACIGEESP